MSTIARAPRHLLAAVQSAASVRAAARRCRGALAIVDMASPYLSQDRGLRLHSRATSGPGPPIPPEEPPQGAPLGYNVPAPPSPGDVTAVLWRPQGYGASRFERRLGGDPTVGIKSWFGGGAKQPPQEYTI